MAFFHGFDDDLLYVDIALRRESIGKESLEDVLLPELLNGVAGELAVKEVHGLGEVIINGGTIAAVVELAESGEEVFRLFVSGL